MHEKPKNPFDPYNFSEIERIQSEIERDLNPPAEEIPEIPEIPALLPAAVEFKEDDFLVTSENFYTETIKQKKPPLAERVRPFRRLAFTLLLISTLGMGSLGFGIGFGIVLLQQRMGIQEQVLGNNPVEMPAVASAVDSTRLMFGNDGTVPVQEGSLADIVRLVDPAVVRVSTVFRDQASFPFFGGANMRYRGGSGIIFDHDAERVLIVTSDHVTRGAEAVNIYIKDKGPFAASLVGRNHLSDLAVISVSLADIRSEGIQDIRVAVFGDSDAMQVGDVVLAIGNAMGEGNAATSGIISAGEKEATVLGRTMRVLQTDAAINPGTSGGALVNKQGQVIGINTVSSVSDHYAIEGMGFSIPSNVAKPIIEDIINAVPRPFLGIEGRNVNDETAIELGIPPIGVYVASVIENSGADRAGLRRGDVITSFGGRAVFNFEQLQTEIGRADVGDTVDVMVIRAGREHLILRVTLGVNSMDNF